MVVTLEVAAAITAVGVSYPVAKLETEAATSLVAYLHATDERMRPRPINDDEIVDMVDGGK